MSRLPLVEAKADLVEAQEALDRAVKKLAVFNVADTYQLRVRILRVRETISYAAGAVGKKLDALVKAEVGG